jgi:hypothetical protein
MLGALAADRARFADLQAQISLLERSLSELQSEKKLVLERLDSYKYPVLTLPNEIIAEIFVHFLPVYPLCPPLTGLDSPALLAQICRKWRYIALATPKLWRAISSDADIPLAQQLHICHTWMTRSCSCPLAIRGLDASQFLAAVAPQRARWEYLSLTVDPAHLPTIEGPLPILHHLDLTLGNDCELAVDDIVTLPEAPLLRSLTLSYTAVRVPTVILPLAHLTWLTLHCVYRDEYVVILQQTSALFQCELIIEVGLDTDPPPTAARIELPRLEVLTLSTLNTLGASSTPTGCLDDFIVPALRDLRVPESFLSPIYIDTLASFVAKSGCKLQELRITDRASVSEEFYRKAFPSTHVSFEK